MKVKEFNERYELYKKTFVTEVSPPKCTACYDDAELYDSAAGENYCESCLRDELKSADNLDFFIEHTSNSTSETMPSGEK